MPDPTYPIDLIGDAATNLVTPAAGTEQKSLIDNDNLNNRVFQPIFAPFFADTLILEFKAAGSDAWQVLHENADFKFAYKFVSAGIASGKRVYAAIIINRGNIAGDIRFKSYQTLGGPWADDKAAANALIASTPYDPRTVFWDEVHGVPDELPLTSHTLAATDLTVHNDLVLAINNLSTAIANGSDNDAVLDYLLRNSDCNSGCDPVDRNYINGILERVRKVNLELQEMFATLGGNLSNLQLNDVLGSVGINTGPSDNTYDNSIGIGTGSAIIKPASNIVAIGVGALKENTVQGPYDFYFDQSSSSTYVPNQGTANTYPSRGNAAIAIGLGAGGLNAKTGTVSIGENAAKSHVSPSAVNIGGNTTAGLTTPPSIKRYSFGVVLGSPDAAGNRSVTNRYINLYGGQDALSIGWKASFEGSSVRGVNIGYRAGHSSSRDQADNVSIGSWAGHDQQNSHRTVNVGHLAGFFKPAISSVNIGDRTGAFNDNYSETTVYEGTSLTGGQGAVSVGMDAGRTSTGPGSVNIGASAGKTCRTAMQSYNFHRSSSATDTTSGTPTPIRDGAGVVNIGWRSGETNAGTHAIGIGTWANNDHAGQGSVSIGRQCGRYFAASNSVNIGGYAQLNGKNSTQRFREAFSFSTGSRVVSDFITLDHSQDSVNIGWAAGMNGSGRRAVMIGVYAGADTRTNNPEDAVCIGHFAGRTLPNANVICIGTNAGAYNANIKSINIGYEAGVINAGDGSINIGESSGESSGSKSINIGESSGELSGYASISIGDSSGQSAGDRSINIGESSGGSYATSAGDRCVNIGANSGSRIPSTAVDVVCIDSMGYPGSTLSDVLYLGNVPKYNSEAEAVTAVKTGMVDSYQKGEVDNASVYRSSDTPGFVWKDSNGFLRII